MHRSDGQVDTLRRIFEETTTTAPCCLNKFFGLGRIVLAYCPCGVATRRVWDPPFKLPRFCTSCSLYLYNPPFVSSIGAVASIGNYIACIFRFRYLPACLQYSKGILPCVLHACSNTLHAVRSDPFTHACSVTPRRSPSTGSRGVRTGPGARHTWMMQPGGTFATPLGA